MRTPVRRCPVHCELCPCAACDSSRVLCFPCTACLPKVHAICSIEAKQTNTPAGEKSAPWVSRLAGVSLSGRTDTRPKAPHDLTPRRTRKPRPYNVKARAPAHCTGVLQACQVSHLSALSTAPLSTPARVRSNVEHGSSGQSGRSVGLVGKTRPVPYPASPSQRPARPRAPWLHILHWPWAEVPRRRHA